MNHRHPLLMVLLAGALLASITLPTIAQPRPAGPSAQDPDAPAMGMHHCPPMVATITVEGQGRVEVRPDQAVIRLGAVAQAQAASDAQEQVSRAVARAIEDIRALNVPAEAIRTAAVSLQPVYSQPSRTPRDAAEPPPQPRIVAYRATNTIQVRLDNIDLVGRVIDAGVAAGVNQLEGLTFGLRDDTRARARALSLAVAQGQVKARAVAGELGVTLGEVHRVQEGGLAVGPPRPFDMGMVRMQTAATPVEPGEISVSATVAITYRIAGGPDQQPAPQDDAHRH